MNTAVAINQRADESTKQLMSAVKDLMSALNDVQRRRKEDNSALSALMKAHDEDFRRLWSDRRQRDLEVCANVAAVRKDRADQRLVLKVMLNRHLSQFKYRTLCA